MSSIFSRPGLACLRNSRASQLAFAESFLNPDFFYLYNFRMKGFFPFLCTIMHEGCLFLEGEATTLVTSFQMIKRPQTKLTFSCQIFFMVFDVEFSECWLQITGLGTHFTNKHSSAFSARSPQHLHLQLSPVRAQSQLLLS